MRHAFTVDLEDWYHGIPIAAADKATAADRLEVGTGRLLALLAQAGVRATFYVLEPVARRHPDLIRRIAAAGHEIGCHGQSHDLIYELGPVRFRAETKAAIEALRDLTGREVRHYRAAYFSITNRSLWALDILAELGITVDSSIFPVRNWRYGIPDYSRAPVRVMTAAGPLVEVPVTTRRLLGRNVPATGGAYFRLFPYALSRWNMRACEAEGMPVVFYIHPWELDPDHPVVPFRRVARLTHYLNLKKTVPRLKRLLADFAFGPLGEILDERYPDLGRSVLRP